MRHANILASSTELVTDGSEFVTTKQVEQKVGEGILSKCQSVVKERGRGDSCNAQGG